MTLIASFDSLHTIFTEYSASELKEKQLRPHRRTLAKLKRWMKNNELNQREAARLLHIRYNLRNLIVPNLSKRRLIRSVF